MSEWCNFCGGFFPVGGAHVCLGPAHFRHTYAPNDPANRSGCQPLRQLTEADVRRIVREEMALSKVEGSQGENKRQPFKLDPPPVYDDHYAATQADTENKT